jgi:hypothetical protein
MKKLLIGFLLALTFVACKDDDDPVEETAFYYLPRTCDYAYTSHFYRTDVGTETGISEFYNTYYVQPLQNNRVATADYLLSVGVSSFNDEMTTMPDFNPNDYLTGADSNMERQIDRYLKQRNSNTSSSSTEPMLNVVDIDYRQEEVKSLKIASTSTIFDIEAGKSLNNKIEIFDTPVYHSFLFTHDKQLIGSVERGWSIDKYLSYRPIASADIYFRFTSTPPEAPLETRFIVEMEMEGGTILRDTTDVVNLLP